MAATGSLAGLTYLVTGSTDGIGLRTARKLAQAGASVLVHGRSAERVERAVASVRSAGGAACGEVTGYTADLSSLQQVRTLASEVRAGHPAGLTCLLNNAGVFEQAPRRSEDGFELTWAVNVVAPYLLTALLLGSVKERIVNVSSISAASSIDFDNLQQERGFSAHNSYSLSKLAAQLFTSALARRLQAAGSPVTCTTLDPGTVNTKMLLAGWGACGIPVGDADDLFYAATSPELAGVTGAYFVSKRQSPYAYRGSDRGQVEERLWAVLEQQAGAAYDLPPGSLVL